MMKIMGIDMSLTSTGWGVVEYDGYDFVHIAHGRIKTTAKQSWRYRLAKLHNATKQLIEKYQPDCIAMETVFVGKNTKTALAHSEGRGSVVCAIPLTIKFSEYHPSTIKSYVSGNGSASKKQMQEAVRLRLGLSKRPQNDAADALGVAMTHGWQLMVDLRAA